MTPATDPQPEVQQVGDKARELLAHEFSMRGQPSVALLIRSSKDLNPDGPYAAAVAAIAAAHEAGRVEGVREAAEVAERMYVKDAFRFEFGHDVATAIRALSKEPTK